MAQALRRLNVDAVLDGELVALDRRGISHFQLLQNALRAEATYATASSTSYFWRVSCATLTLLERKGACAAC